MSFPSILTLIFLCLPVSCTEQSAKKDRDEDNDYPKELLLGGLLPSPGEEHLKKEVVIASELARTIESLDGIQGARVHLNLADRSPLSRSPNATSRAAIVIKHDASKNLDTERIKHLASAAVQDLEQSEVVIFETPISSPERKTVWVGPIEVELSSARTAKICLGGLLIVCILMALGLVGAGFKLRKMKSKF